jgi:hypothetical protein
MYFGNHCWLNISISTYLNKILVLLYLYINVPIACRSGGSSGPGENKRNNSQGSQEAQQETGMPHLIYIYVHKLIDIAEHDFFFILVILESLDLVFEGTV